MRVALGIASVEICGSADLDSSDSVSIDELVLSVAARLGVCAGPTAVATSSPTSTASPTPSPTPSAEPTVPTNSSDLLAWLQAGRYLDWQAESAIHASAGPHFGRVRTYLNGAVLDSLATGRAQHPAGAALVKELYGGEGDAIQGWSVMVKTQEDSDGGRGWYWYERFGGGTFAAGNGVPLCYGCHGGNFGGLTSRDFVLSPFPLQ